MKIITGQKKYNTILFDLDGTITDPKEGITKSVQYSLRKFGIEIDNPDDLEKFIGPPLKQSFIDFFSFTGEEALAAVEYYREYFKTDGIFENSVYEDIPGLLEKLKSADLTLAVATSKPTVFAEKIINHFNLSGYFKIVTGSNMDNTGTDKKDVIAQAMSKLHCNPLNTIMIGDRMHDIIGAKKNSIDSIGVLYGYGTAEELTEAAPDYIVESVRDIANIVLN